MHVRRTVKRGFLTGLVLFAPLAVTAFVVQFVYGWLVSQIRPVLRAVPGVTVPFAEPLALVVLFGLITGAGLVFLRGFGGGVMTEFDRFMQRIPGISPIYRSVRQATSAFTGNDANFERVGLVKLPESGLLTIGFITAETPRRLQEAGATDIDPERTWYNVFVPMAPNPMGGFLVIVPESRLTMTDLTVREGVQLIMTTGVGSDTEFDLEEVFPGEDG